jgi:hypothetical protein
MKLSADPLFMMPYIQFSTYSPFQSRDLVPLTSHGTLPPGVASSEEPDELVEVVAGYEVGLVHQEDGLVVPG